MHGTSTRKVALEGRKQRGSKELRKRARGQAFCDLLKRTVKTSTGSGLKDYKPCQKGEKVSQAVLQMICKKG